LPREARRLAAVLAGSRDGWLDKPQPVVVWDLKGLALAIIERAIGRAGTVTPIGAERLAQQREPELAKLASAYHPRGAADLEVDGQLVGSFGPIHPSVAAAADVGEGVLLLELDLDALDRLGVAIPRFQPIPGLPPATRDVALVVHEDVPAGVVEQAVR